MMGLVLIAFIVLIILMLSIKSQLSTKVEILTYKIDSLKDLLNQANVDVKKNDVIKESPEEVEDILTNEIELEEMEEEPILVFEEEVVITPLPVIQEEISVPIIHPIETESLDIKPSESQQTFINKPEPSFFEKNPDLEKFIGENLINKIGIAILVLGIGFFVKYAISQNWINEIGRTAIGILCGGILITLAHKLRKTFTAFSSVLVGGGLAVLYFTISIAFHQYQVFSQTAAFIIMVVITAFSVLLSISYDRKELAILAIIGGFSSPFMLSTGEGNYVVLFTYVAILNIGMLALAYFKKWNILNIISYIFTIVLYSGWLITKVISVENAPYIGALIFATIFYLVFFLMNIINNVKENRLFNALEISMLLSNTVLYYSAGMYILLNVQNGDYQGLFTALIAVFNFIFSYLLYKNENVDKNLVFLLIGLVLTFISLAAPVQLNGNYITLFWAAETVLLLWFSQKSEIQLMKKASIIVMGLMVISLIMDWKQFYFSHNYTYILQATGEKISPIIFNKGFITGIIAFISLCLSVIFLNKEQKEFIMGVKVNHYKTMLGVAMLIILYTSILLELKYQLDVFVAHSSIRTTIIGSYNYIYLIALSFLARKKEIAYFLEITIFLGFISIIFYPLYYHFRVIDIRNLYLMDNQVGISGFLIHYINVGLVLFLLFKSYKNLQLKSSLMTDFNKPIIWYLSFILLFLASSELDHMVVLNVFSPNYTIDYALIQSHKIGFPILWGICSFILMFIGMRAKIKDVRIISLTLFLVIILKLFLFDIRGISEGGKIAAFISLGVILLIVSFMYQKLKKLILEDDSKIKSE